MAFKVSDLIKIARAEIGYREKATNSQLDDKTANPGSNNFTKYGRDLYAAGYYNGNKNGVAWCDQFYDWCVFQLAGKNKKVAEAIQYQTGDCGAGCKFSAQYYRNAGKFFTSNPQPGDQIFFGKVGSESHTGMVVEVNGSAIKTVEGNSGNMVKELTYSVNSPNIAGYGRPNLNVDVTATKPTQTTTTKPVQTTPTQTTSGTLVIPKASFVNGAQLNLKGVALYGSSLTSKVANKLTGTYYLWSTKAVKGRVRITNLTKNVGKLFQITGWISEKDARVALFKPFKVRVVDPDLNIRVGAGTNYRITGTLKNGTVVTIVDVAGKWGKISDGRGWIYLNKKYVVNN